MKSATAKALAESWERFKKWALENGWTLWGSPQEMMQAARAKHYPREKMQETKRQTRYCYTDGPMFFLGQQIVKAMQDAGYPAKILYCHRTAEEQAALYAKGRTKPGRIVTRAKQWQSAHNYYDAVDIIHPSLAWKVAEEYWETLAACVKIVSEKYDVKLTHGHYWKFRDSAHIELADWRQHREQHIARCTREAIREKTQVKMRPLDADELWERFQQVLPKVANRYLADKLQEPPAPANTRAMKRAREVARLG